MIYPPPGEETLMDTTGSISISDTPVPVRFKVYKHHYVTSDNLIIPRQFIVLEYSDGTIRFTDFHKYVRYPDIASWWSDENDISADDVFPDSAKYVKWVCPTCHGTYGASIKDMVSGEADCPYCNDRKVLPGFNSLKVKYPEIASLWSDENDISTDDVLSSSPRYVQWICPTCHGAYSASIKDMVSGEADCPYCTGRQVLPGFNSFKIKHPDLMDEWLYLNNSLLADPDQISENYNKKVWWECSQGHHYPMSPAKRIMFQKRHREPCPFCKGRRLKLRHYY
jgi:DNA-directed RNA polymerase subunit RPC12/RpoP